MSQSLRGHYLIAGKHLRDPNFFRAVVLIVDDNESGSMGFILNRPTDVEVKTALTDHFSAPNAEVPVFFGGPVEPSALFLLHDDESLAADLSVVPGTFLGTDAEMFETIVTSPEEMGVHYRVFAGCAGWGPGQLNDELARRDWHVAEADHAGIFLANPYDQWESLIQRMAKAHPLFPDSQTNHLLN